jgi:hypothetical protein
MKRMTLAAFAATISAAAVIAASAQALPMEISGTSGANTSVHGGLTFHCTGDTFKGTYDNSTGETHITSFTATGCDEGTRGICSSPGAEPGEVHLHPLGGPVGTISGSGGKVGVALTPKEGETVAEYHCTNSETKITTQVKISGGFVGVLSPINKATTSFTLGFAETGGVEAWHKLEGGPVETLSASVNEGEPEETGFASSESITSAKPVSASTLGGTPHFVVAPTWKACVKAEPKNTGNYSDKSCTVSAGGTGKYELAEGIGKGKGFKGRVSKPPFTP